jgi:GT2 family glycosyltransferase
MERDGEELYQQIFRLQDTLQGKGRELSREELLNATGLLADIVRRLEFRDERLRLHNAELEDRLLRIENSRFFRGLRSLGRAFSILRGRSEQLLLDSPLHPIFAKRLRRECDKEYRLWVELEQPLKQPWLRRSPLISVVVALHDPRREWLEAAVQSVLDQTYDRWELCVCGDASTEGWAAEFLARKSAGDHRIRFVQARGRLGIAEALNRAGESAGGEYVGFLGQDDVLSPHALHAAVGTLETGPAEVLYTDEDHLTRDGLRVEPVFKPAFSPDLLHCCMYMSHFLVVRREKLDEIGWFRAGYDGGHDYDLALRAVENGAVVHHIAQVLYHARQPSRAGNAPPTGSNDGAGFRALSDAVRKKDPNAIVLPRAPNAYRVRWAIAEGATASIVICSRNASLLARCLGAIERKTSYQPREIVVVQHRAGDTAAMDRLLARSHCRRVHYAGPFNFAKMNNLGALQANGSVLVFLNDDVEPLAPEWLEELLAHALRPEVGAVGARLLYPSGAIQHAGIAINPRGAEHVHRNSFGARHWNWLPFTRNVSAVTGACLAIRSDLFRDLGGFDEAFPANYNDVDLCLRVRSFGYEVILEPSAVLRHRECSSREPGVRMAERDRFEERWGAVLRHSDPYYSPWLACAPGKERLDPHANPRLRTVIAPKSGDPQTQVRCCPATSWKKSNDFDADSVQ